jgi:hypothetical protein
MIILILIIKSKSAKNGKQLESICEVVVETLKDAHLYLFVGDAFSKIGGRSYHD